MTGSTEAAADAPRAPAARTPDFFVVGHPKCGTTALYEMLRRHPGIFMPELKETWFFVPELRTREPAGRPSKRPHTLEEYTALFADAAPGQRVGEATPSYLRSLFAARRIAEVQPRARIVAVFREPASFLRSFHLQCLESHTETEKDLRKAIALEEPRRAGRCIPARSTQPEALLYSDHVRYVEQLRRFHAAFAPAQVLALIYDDFRRDNEATIRRVLRFLEVDEEQPIPLIEANPSVRVRSATIEGLVRRLEHGIGPAERTLRTAVRTATPRDLRRRALRATQRRILYGDPGPPDEQLMRELRRRFKPEVVALGEYLDRDLVTLWGYDHVD